MQSKSAVSTVLSRFSTLLIASLAAYGVPAAVLAQTATFTGSQGVAFSSETHTPYGVALDITGNLYIADALNNQVLKVPAGGGEPTTVGSGLYFPTGVAVDSKGNVYIADSRNNRVVKVPGVGPEALGIPIGLGFKSPSAVAVDASGNVYVADTGNNQVVEVAANGIQTALSAGFDQPSGLALDSFGNLYVADTGNNRIAILQWTGYSFSAAKTSVSGLNSPTGIAFDPSNSLYIAENKGSQILKSTLSASGGYGAPVAFVGGFEDARTVTVGPHGALFIGDTGTQEVLNFLPPGPSVNFGNANLCPAGQTQPAPCSKTVTLSFQVAGIGSDTPSFTALTLGTPNLDFKVDAVASSCPNNGNGLACSVNVVFTPLYAGSRRGALNLYDSTNGNVLTTVLIYGTGDGPQGNFTFGGPIPWYSGPGQPQGVAVDGAGDIYVADSDFDGAPNVYEIPAGHGQPTSVALSQGYPLFSPNEIAVDGAGNVYVADSQSPFVTELYAAGWSMFLDNTNQFGPSSFNGVAVDGAGIVFITASCAISLPANGTVWQIPAGGGSALSSNPIVDGLGMSCPGGLALDSAGNLYIADSGNGRVIEVPADGAAPFAVGSGFKKPLGVAVDAEENVFVADTGNSRLAEVPAGTNEVITLATAKTLGVPPNAVALDEQGNLFFTGYTSSNGKTNSLVAELPRLVVPGLTWAMPLPIYFGTALKAAQLNATVQSGIAGQIIYAPSAGTVLSVGTHTLTATFTPTDMQKYASNTASVTLVVQPALAPATATPTFTPAPGEYSSTQSVTIVVATSGAQIYYTTDGSTPTTSSTPYAGAIAVSQSETIQAIALAPNHTASQVASGDYSIRVPVMRQTATPTLTPAPGEYDLPQSVTIVDVTPGAQIYYTTDGTTPTTASTPYTGAIAVSQTETIQAIATAPDHTESAMASGTYRFPLPPVLNK